MTHRGARSAAVRRDEGTPSLAVARAANWLGLAWVYSGAFWLMALYGAVTSGWPEGAFAIALRLVATLALGVGLCALERWAWATVVSACAFYTAVGLAAALLAVIKLTAGPPGSNLSWMPVLWGLRASTVASGGWLGIAGGAVAGGMLLFLWHARPLYDVPPRRAFTCLVRLGLFPAIALAALDGYLFGSVLLSLRG